MNKQLPKNGYGYIYKYTSPSGKSYIGQTITSLYNRAGGSRGKTYIKCPVFYNAIIKYGFSNFDVEILVEAPISQLNILEKKYIEIFNTLVPDGYNIQEGGEGGNTKIVYQYNMDGQFVRQFNSVREAADSIGREPQGISDCLHGRALSCGNYYWSLQKLEKYPIAEKTDFLKIRNDKKQVRMLDLNGNLIRTFKSIGEAAKFCNGERSAIKRCCRHELHTYCGYKWECSEILAEKKYNNSARAIEQLDKETGEAIKTFPSISAAAREFHKNGTSLFRRALNDIHYSAYGYKWRYAQSSTTISL